ncbi:MAG TPA: hypothetical protein VF384_12705 [Planctomycetota bacterium]
MRTYLLVAFCFLLASCSTVDFAQVDAKAFGPAPSAFVLQTAAEKNLRDSSPDAERTVRWFDEQPQQAALYTGFLIGSWTYGWAMRFGVNEKSRFGGHTGERVYYVMMSGDDLWVDEVASSDFKVNDTPAAPAR